MKKIIAALTLVMLSQTALAAEWYLVSVGSTDFFFYVDKSSVTRNGSKVKFWLRAVTTEPMNKPPYDNTVSLHVADCKERTLAMEYIQASNGNTLIRSGKTPDQTAEPVPPDTPFSTVLTTVCSGKYMGTPSEQSIQEIQSYMKTFYAEQQKK